MALHHCGRFLADFHEKVKTLWAFVVLENFFLWLLKIIYKLDILHSFVNKDIFHKQLISNIRIL